MKKRIRITRARIMNGLRGDTYRCPVALAIMPHLREGTSVMANEDSVTIDYSYEVETPPIAQEFIREFDDRMYGTYELNPFSFTLDIPTDYLKVK